jgi:hypothetical protein
MTRDDVRAQLLMEQEDLRVLREKVLHDCAPQDAFWTCHGAIIRNIYELVVAIKALNDYAFRYHVNNDHFKNDFAKWIDEVLKDRLLAVRLQDVLDKQAYVGIIESRVKELENA